MGADKAALWIGVVAIVVSIVIPLGTQAATGHVPRWLSGSATALVVVGVVFAYLGSVGAPATSSAAAPTSAPPPAATTEPVTPPALTSTPTVSEPAPTSGRSITLSAVSEASRHVTVTAELNRPPRQGHVYWFVLEVHDVSGTHSEWYPRTELRSSGPFLVTIPEDADITRPRTGAVYEVTAQVDEYYRSGRPDPKATDDFLLAEPCNCAVSDVITMPF